MAISSGTLRYAVPIVKKLMKRMGTAFPLLNLKYGRTHSVKDYSAHVTRLYYYSLQTQTHSVNRNNLTVRLVSQLGCTNGKLAPFKWSFSSASKLHSVGTRAL